MRKVSGALDAAGRSWPVANARPLSPLPLCPWPLTRGRPTVARVARRVYCTGSSFPRARFSHGPWRMVPTGKTIKPRWVKMPSMCR